MKNFKKTLLLDILKKKKDIYKKFFTQIVRLFLAMTSYKTIQNNIGELRNVCIRVFVSLCNFTIFDSRSSTLLIIKMLYQNFRSNACELVKSCFN